MRETQESITKWARETFGRPDSNLQLLVRAQEEMTEAVKKAITCDDDPGIAEEIADIVIVLMPVLTNLGAGLHDMINAKMAVNRKRKWKTKGDGVGQHIPE